MESTPFGTDNDYAAILRAIEHGLPPEAGEVALNDENADTVNMSVKRLCLFIGAESYRKSLVTYMPRIRAVWNKLVEVVARAEKITSTFDAKDVNTCILYTRAFRFYVKAACALHAALASADADAVGNAVDTDGIVASVETSLRNVISHEAYRMSGPWVKLWVLTRTRLCEKSSEGTEETTGLLHKMLERHKEENPDCKCSMDQIVRQAISAVRTGQRQGASSAKRIAVHFAMIPLPQNPGDSA